MPPGAEKPLLETPGEEQEAKEARKRFFMKVAAIGAIVIIVGGIAFSQRQAIIAGIGAVREYIKSLGYGAMPIVFILTWIFTTISAPVVALEMGAGAMFQQEYGLNKGMLVALACVLPGVWCGCQTGFWLSRKYFKHYVQELIDNNKVLSTVNKIIEKEGWKFTFLMRLNPMIPFELFNYAVGLTDISLEQNMIATFGTMPIVCFEVYSAASAAAIVGAGAGEGEDKNAEIVEVLVKLAVCAVLIALVALYGKKKYDEKVAEDLENAGEGPGPAKVASAASNATAGTTASHSSRRSSTRGEMRGLAHQLSTQIITGRASFGNVETNQRGP